jgi:anti-sigma factor RsiW
MDGMNWLFREPERDSTLGDALRQMQSVPEPGDADALRRRIIAAARPALGRLGSRAPKWWEWISGWTRIAVPVGLAAAVAAGLLVQGSISAGNAGVSSTDMGSDSTLVFAAFSEPAAGSQLTGYLIAPDGNDWLLEQAVGQ